METLSMTSIPELFDAVASMFSEKRDELCALDAAMGDGDLGLTMSKGYGALPEFLRSLLDEGDVGTMLFKGAMRMQNAVPSTMGTLMASGIMAAGKALRGKSELVPADLVTYFTHFAVGVKGRGKCELGDRTLLDAMDAAAQSASAILESHPDAGFSDIADAAAKGAEQGVEATKDMVPKFGKAVVHAAKARGVADQGALAGKYMVDGMANYFREQG